jgi:hypothetical protein
MVSNNLLISHMLNKSSRSEAMMFERMNGTTITKIISGRRLWRGSKDKRRRVKWWSWWWKHWRWRWNNRNGRER